MSNLSIKIDLLKLKNAFVTDIKGNTATKTCIVIPIEDAGLFLGEKGLYLDLTGVELKEAKFEQSHFIRCNVSKEVYAAMSDEQRKAIPIVGNIKLMDRRVQDSAYTTEVVETVVVDDLPF